MAINNFVSGDSVCPGIEMARPDLRELRQDPGPRAPAVSHAVLGRAGPHPGRRDWSEAAHRPSATLLSDTAVTAESRSACP